MVDEEDCAAIEAFVQQWQQNLRNEARNEGREEGRKEGHREGLREGERDLILRQLRARFGELPAAAVARIEAAEVADLERWAERLLTTQTLDDVLDDPS